MFSRLLIWIFLLPSLCAGQTAVGLKAGLNLSDVVMTNYVNPDVESDLGIRAGLHAGVFVSGMVNDKIGMAAELMYSDKGVKGLTNIHLHYVALPLIVQYRITDRMVAELGPEPAYLFSATSGHGNVSGTYNNKFDLSLDGGLRLDVSNWVLGIRYCVGLFSVREPIDVVGSSGAEKIKYQNRVVQFSIGYKLFSLED